MILFAILAAGISTMWLPARWALSAFQVATLGLGAARLAVRDIKVDLSAVALAAEAAQMLAGMEEGWTQSIDRLEAYLGRIIP